jgi:hypothetical protein
MRCVLHFGAALAVLAIGLPTSSADVRAGAAVPTCRPVPMPFAGIGDASLRPEVHVSKDATPVAYVRWRGTAPSFDGMPLSVDVTIPCGGATRRPPGPPATTVATRSAWPAGAAALGIVLVALALWGRRRTRRARPQGTERVQR